MDLWTLLFIANEWWYWVHSGLDARAVKYKKTLSSVKLSVTSFCPLILS